ncbi:MAG: hypothetical protein Kow0013_26380 [Pararhodobacter sp.]
MSRTAAQRRKRIRDSAEALFGKRVTEVTAPGGSGRASLRFHFGDQTVIGTLRPNFRRTHIEAFVLRRLEPFCDDIPRCLGVDREVMFQTDVGDRRLNLELHAVDAARQADLLAEAVAAIFRIQAAAHRTDLHDKMPHLGNNPDWIGNLVDGVSVLEGFGPGVPDSFDPEAAAARLGHPGVQFVKWDCRSSNAAIGADGRLRWFDFEYCGLRHGAEDLAWLFADESQPADGATLWRIAEDALPAAPLGGRDDYLDYLAVYTVFHALQRLILIIDEANARGWLPRRRVLERDDVGVNPMMARNLCRVARDFANRAPITAMLAPALDAVATFFDKVLTEGAA